MNKEQILERHQEIIDTIERLKQEQKEMFKEYFAEMGIKKRNYIYIRGLL